MSTNTQQDEQLLTVDETAARLCLVAPYVRRLIQRGELPCVRIGRAVRVRRGDLAAFIDSRTQPATAK